MAALQQALTIVFRISGSVVEFLPTTQETGVRFPANAFTIWHSQSLSRQFFLEN